MRTARAALLVMCALGGSGALAQGTPSPYPVKPIRIVVPFPAGGTSDILSRAIGQKLTEEWKQQVIVDPRPGASANIGAEIVVKAPPDGYTLLMASTIHAINPSLYPKLGYDPLRDFTPLTPVAATSQVLTVHPNVPARSVKELIAYAKKNPDVLSYSSAGNGSQPHLTAELFKSMTGIDMLHVPHKGAPPAMLDLLAGQVALTFATAPSAVPHVKAGRLRALGVSTAQRIGALPDVPTIAEAGVRGFEASGWNGLVGPAGMPPAIVDKITTAVTRIVKEPVTARFLSDQGADPVTMTPQEFGAYLEAEMAKWAKVVKVSGAKID